MKYPAAMGENSIMDFVPRYKDYEFQREQTHEFIKDLMIYAERIESTLRQENGLLRQQLRDAHLDLEDASSSRRELQQRLLNTEAQIGFVSRDNDTLKKKNPYVMALIDGNGLIFQEDFIRQGLAGGKKAALTLRDAVFRRCKDADETEIAAKIIVDVAGMGELLKRAGLINNESDLREFMVGFTQAKTSFDVVDVGHSKQGLEAKLRDAAKWNLGNYNCKQVLLGVSHDAGFADFLAGLPVDDKGRLTILEGCPVVPEIRSTGIGTVDFAGLFRDEKVVEKVVEKRPPSVRAAASPAPAPAPGTPRSSTPSASGSISYATITQSQKASPPPQLTLPLPLKSKESTASRTPRALPPPWNPGPRGVDTPIPINQAALENIKKRKEHNKLCNNHYLRGPCTKGDECCFEHHYSPNKDEINAIALLARLNPCTNGQDCDVDNCIYGHHCPSVVHGICTHPYCKFRPEEHPPGTKLQVARR